jgi:hypothetical protein
LPEGYRVGTDSQRSPGMRFHILPPGQEHARPYNGVFPTEEMAVSDAIETLNRHELEAWEQRRSFNSGHWSERNILAHVRFDERTDADGKRVLFIEEIQSDWHQQGRKRGYRGSEPQFFKVVDASGLMQRGAMTRELADQFAREHGFTVEPDVGRPEMAGVPDAPFKTTWPELAFKRMLRWAAENGFDRIAWTTGEQQNERYSLEQHLGAIEWFDHDQDGRGMLVAFSQQGGHLWEREINRDEIGEYIGEDTARRLLSAESTRNRGMHYRIEGGDLRSGGAGMRGFYDDILPKTVNKLVKKWGGKVSTTGIDAGHTRPKEIERADPLEQVPFEPVPDYEKVHSVDITPAMRDAAMEGLPMFSRTDVMERRQPKGTEEARGYAKLANAVIDIWNRKVGRMYGPLGNLPEAKKYLIERYKTLGGLTHVREVTRGVFQALSNATPEDAQRVYAYLTTAGALPDDIEDAAVRNVAITTKQAIDLQGRALVEAGLLSEESYETYRDQYLPRLYLRHILGDKTGGRMMGSGKRLSDMGYLKQRKDIPEEVRKVILGEITDPAFLAAFGLSRTMRDMTIMNFLQSISQNAAWAPQVMLIDWDGRKVSPFWLQSEAKQLRKQADHIKHKLTADKARAIADRMDSLANRALEELDALDLSDFKQIPDSGRYGALRGLYVRKEIHEDLVGAHQFVESDSLLENIFGQGGVLTKATRAWKTSKVAMNVPSHFRNMMGNAMMLHLSGIPLARLPDRLVSALHSVISKDGWFQIAQKYGLKEATFANTELYRIRDEWLLLQRSKQPTVNHLHALFAKITAKVGDVYQFEEALFKIAKLRDAMEREGLGEADAMIEAHKWIFDYSLVPRWVRYLRNAPFGVPFLSYSYFALPRLAETAIKRPWKFLPYLMVGYAIQQALMNMYGADDDDLDKLRGAFPEWMKSRGGMMLLPWKDQEGRWQVVDLGYTVPWGQLLDTAAAAREGNYRQSAETMGLFSGPLPDLIAAWQTNIDPFTGREIANPADPTWKRVQSVLGYAYGMAAPGFLTGTGAGGKIIDAYTGKVDPRTGDPTLTKSQALLRLFGISVYPVDPEVTRGRNLRSMGFEIDEVRKRMGEQLRDRNLTDQQKDEVRRVYKEEIQLRVDKMRKYQEESEIPENLRRVRPDDLTGRIAPLIDGKSKPEVVRSLRDAGYPALAALFEDLPAHPRPAALEALRA